MKPDTAVGNTGYLSCGGISMFIKFVSKTGVHGGFSELSWRAGPWVSLHLADVALCGHPVPTPTDPVQSVTFTAHPRDPLLPQPSETMQSGLHCTLVQTFLALQTGLTDGQTLEFNIIVVLVDSVRVRLWTAASNGRIFHPQGDTWVWEPRWNDIYRREQRNSEKNLSQWHCPPQI
jgi:hypothetical protein